METPDHKNPNSSGHGGGHHVCHKCGWPYPNAHPSSKNRRAHKKVCGTIDKYRLDDNALEKPLVEGHDGEQHSDDEFETPSDKGVKGTISRRSSSGVGSRSSRSNRSEDEVFTDAVTEFNENPAGEASGGALQRFYSIQNENERDDTKRPEENLIVGADNINQIDHFKDNQLQTDENVVADKVESGMASQNQISTDPSLVSVGVTSEMETTVDPKIEQPCDPSGELDTVSKRGEEIKASKDESSLETSSSETPVEAADVRDLQGACDETHGGSGEHLASISANTLMKTSLFEDVVGDNDGRFDVLDSSEREETKKEKTEISDEAISPGDLYPPVHLGEAVNSGNGNLNKSELFEERDSKIGSSDSVYALLGSDVLPLEQHPEIEVEDSNHISGKNSVSVAPDPTADFVGHVKGCSVESGSDAAFIQTNDGDRTFLEDSSVRSLEKKHDSQKYVDEQKTCEEPDHRADVESSDADVNISNSEGTDDLKSDNDSATKEKKSITSLENIFPEGPAIDALKTTSTVDSTRSDIEDDGEYITVMDTVGTKVAEDDLAVKNSASILPSRDEVAVEVAENRHICTEMSSDENIKVEGVTLSENVTPDKIADHGKSDKVLDSGDMMVGHSQGESVFSSQCVEEIGDSEKKIQTENIVADDGTVSTVNTDGHLNSTSKVEVDVDAKSSESIDKVVEDTSRITEGDRVIKQPVTNSAADAIVDSGSLTDSLDGNWGSVSVMSTTSDVIPTADTIASNLPRSLEGEESSSVVSKPVLDNQHSQNQVPVNPEVEIQQPELASEIHPSNEPIRGKKDKEIIDKVSNWDSGKQNTPLKTLLGEATARSRAESPIHHYQTSSSTSVLKTDTITGTNDGLSDKTENVILKSDRSEMETAHDMTGKEWNSPARYPVNIKTEKRRSKRTYWAPFLCCSSVNAR